MLRGDTYEDIVDALAHRIVAAAALTAAARAAAGARYVVGVAGAPGSGKSTLARLLCDRINAASGVGVGVGSVDGGAGSGVGSVDIGNPVAPACAVVPMDGFHLYKRQLDEMSDPEEAYARRGAHWTFDARRFVDCVRRIAREPGDALAPSFDHGVGDVSVVRVVVV